ncbi:MAG: hydroxyethylthiazole kinase [Coriobacteriia bacterium]|nr:hydroxyethylthiazole kinase [Coriobacteriia bacterium]
MQNLGSYLSRVHEMHPLIHNITNYVTVHDVANVEIAAGASPVMTDGALDDVRDMARLVSGLNINIGTPRQSYEEVCMAALNSAAETGAVIVLDPVGAGATAYRSELSKKLLETGKLTAVKGNISEIGALFGGQGNTQGVDADLAESVHEENIDEVAKKLQAYAAQYNLIIVATGAIDLIVDAKQAYAVYNGTPMQSEITGAGCMLSGILTSYLAANKDDMLAAALAAVCMFGIAGERAEQLMLEYGRGNASFSNYLIDEVYLMDAERLDDNADFEQR